MIISIPKIFEKKSFDSIIMNTSQKNQPRIFLYSWILYMMIFSPDIILGCLLMKKRA